MGYTQRKIKKTFKEKLAIAFKVAKNVVIVLLLLVLVCRIFIFDYLVIDGESMDSSSKEFQDGDIIIINKIDKEISRYDVVIANVKKDHIPVQFVKRVIGLPGETIQIINHRFYINGMYLDDVVDEDIEDEGLAAHEIKLADDEYFIVGDNRNDSVDSRVIGPVKKKDIVGKYSHVIHIKK